MAKNSEALPEVNPEQIIEQEEYARPETISLNELHDASEKLQRLEEDDEHTSSQEIREAHEDLKGIFRSEGGASEDIYAVREPSQSEEVDRTVLRNSHLLRYEVDLATSRVDGKSKQLKDAMDKNMSQARQAEADRLGVDRERYERFISSGNSENLTPKERSKVKWDWRWGKIKKFFGAK